MDVIQQGDYEELRSLNVLLADGTY